MCYTLVREKKIMGDSHSLSVNDLLCTENEACLNDDDDDDNDVKVVVVVADDEHEYVKILLDRELLSFGVQKGDEILGFDSWIRFSRLDTIDWILKTRDIFRFQFKTVYLCMTYFDRFLSRRSIDSGKVWAIRLLSVACLSLAAKLEESKVPALSNFRMDDVEFESKVIRKMELLVMSTLGWKLDSVTPFGYLPYFVTTLCSSSPTIGLASKASQLVLDIVKDINLINYRPSVIAAAAVLMAFEQRLTRKEIESRMKGTFCHGYLDLEDIYTCYSLMQNLETREGHEPFNFASTPDMSPSQFRPAFDSTENTSATPALSHKRKRLTFNDSDQNDQPPAR